MSDPKADSPVESESALAAVLDGLIPPSQDGRLPGAGALGLAGEVRGKIGEAWPFVAQGLAALDALAAEHGAADFASVPGPERAALMNQLEASQPGFLPSLIFHTYGSYYQHLQVVEALGLEPRPPHPKGYELEAGDLSLLENVRARGPQYRDA